MIKVSVRPGGIVVGRETRLAISFVNAGPDPCTDIDFRFEVPASFSLLEGRTRGRIPSLRAGAAHVHEIVVVASRSGEFELASTRRVSYRDQYNVPKPGDAFRCKISVAGTVARRGPTAVPRIEIRLDNAGVTLPVGRWGELKLQARNSADVPLDDVVIKVTGPLRTNGQQPRIARLGPGMTAPFPFKVLADEGGLVPVGARTTFTYRDGAGSIRQGTQEDWLEVKATGGVNAEPAKRGPAKILYLTASPHDPDLEWLPLRSDLEMRKVMERLQLSRQRDDYKFESCPAARWVDLNQALVDHDPQVMHFSCHGDADGMLLLETDGGGVAPTTPEGLARLFHLHRSTLRCVIVNACHSERLARAVVDPIEYVIGMRSRIGDEAAIQFSVGFYTGFFAGQPVPDAFERGIASIESSETTKPEYRTPILLSAR